MISYIVILLDRKDIIQGYKKPEIRLNLTRYTLYKTLLTILLGVKYNTKYEKINKYRQLSIRPRWAHVHAATGSKEFGVSALGFLCSFIAVFCLFCVTRVSQLDVGTQPAPI